MVLIVNLRRVPQQEPKGGQESKAHPRRNLNHFAAMLVACFRKFELSVKSRRLDIPIKNLCAWHTFNDRKDLSKISREQHHFSSKWPLTSGNISHGAVDCIDVVAWTRHKIVPNDQIGILKGTSQLTFGWNSAGIGITAQNQYFEGRMYNTASSKKLSSHCLCGNGSEVLVMEL